MFGIKHRSNKICFDSTKAKNQKSHKNKNPTENLKIVQIVDEREADQGILKVEVKATSNGLVPELDQLLKPSLDNFLRTELSGGEISISKLDAESKKGSPISERNWILTFTRAENESTGKDLNFSFPEPIP